VAATLNAKALAWLARGLDSGRLALIALVASLALGAALTAAELTGIDGLCVTRIDEAVFVAFAAAASAMLVLAYALRGAKALRGLLWTNCSLCLIFILYFPVTPISAMVLVAYVALPLSLYLPFPTGFLATCAVLGLDCAARFLAFPPEAIGQRSASFRDLVSFVAAPAVASALVSPIAALRAELDRLSESLLKVTKLNLSYQDYSASVEEKSALEERLRLTRDIHDVVGYALTNTIMTMRAASIMCAKEPEKVPSLLDSARADADQALTQVRGILGDLRRREIRSAAGPLAIAKAVRAFKTATGVEVDLDFGNFDWTTFGGAEYGGGQWGNEAAFATSHFVQEGMLNAFNHGKATEIRVSFRSGKEGLVVSVRDNGSGAKGLQEGIGISGMRERIEKLGGSVEYGNSVDGFCIEMRLPSAPPSGVAGAATSGAGEAEGAEGGG
jgi:signal transduction histidine kinase